MVFTCKKTKLMDGESVRYSTAYKYYNNKIAIGRCVVTKKIRGNFKGWLNISNVIIYKDHRGKGYCPKMLKCVLNKYNNNKIYIEVYKNNTPAIKCYLSSGFKVYKIVKNEIIMEFINNKREKIIS